MGVYPLHAVTGLLGPAVTVVAMSDRTRSGFTVAEGPYAGRRVAVESDDNWQVVLRLAGGTLATVQSGSCIGQPLGPDLELNGELGTIALSLIEGSHPVRVFTADRGWFEEPVAHARPEGPDHLLGVEHLVDCIEHGRAPVSTSTTHCTSSTSGRRPPSRPGREASSTSTASSPQPLDRKGFTDDGF